MKIKDSKWWYFGFTGLTGAFVGWGWQHILFDKIGWFCIIPMLIHAIFLGRTMGMFLGRLEAYEEFDEEVKKITERMKDNIVFTETELFKN